MRVRRAGLVVGRRGRFPWLCWWRWASWRHQSRGGTLREVAARACVGLVAARHALCYLRRSAAVVIVRTRRVPYRNKPVAEYALPDPAQAPAVTSGGGMGALLSAWGGAVDNF